MVWLSHPTGNSFVRALLKAFQQAELDYSFFTSIAFDPTCWWGNLVGKKAHAELSRRSFDVPANRCHQKPGREIGRLLLSRLLSPQAAAQVTQRFSVDAVYQNLDHHVAQELRRARQPVEAVFAYEDGACQTFEAARDLGTRRCYSLPIAYWETSRRLLETEAERWPEWEPTLQATRDSDSKLERKSRELDLADVVICPSSFVHQSLPNHVRDTKQCVIAEFGSHPSPEPHPIQNPSRRHSQALIKKDSPSVASAKEGLQILFAGTLTQRKGLADLFAAMRLLRRKDVKLTVLGTPLMPMSFYRSQYADFHYEPPRPHHEVITLMQQCDLLVLPSIVEGRALVQQEALACGLPLIITPNTGGEDLIDPGRTGRLVPPGSPEKIAEAICWFADHRSLLPAMRDHAREKAAQFTWTAYAQKILRATHLAPTKELEPA